LALDVAMAKRTFYLSLRNRFGGAIAGFFLLATVVAWPHIALMAALSVQALMFMAILLVVCTVSVSAEGVTLNRVNRARWTDISSAEPVRFLGLPYLIVRRNKGWRWWVPLYLRNLPEFQNALLESAPPGNPLHTYAASRSNTYNSFKPRRGSA